MIHGPARSYEQTRQAEPGAWSIPGWEFAPRPARGHRPGRPCFERLARMARMAVGRLGARLEPWLDEGLVVGRALMALLELGEPAIDIPPSAEARAVNAVVEGLRNWIRGGGWFEAAWRRTETLCRVATEVGVECPELLAEELGLDDSRLETAFAEAGLVFGVCPERMLPAARVTPEDQSLVAAVVGELPERQRTVLTLYFREGLGFAEIAELLDLGAGDLQGLYGRAAVHVRSSLCGSQLGEGPPAQAARGNR